MEIFYIPEWDRYWDKNQDAIVKHTIWKYLKHSDTKVNCDKLLVTRAKMEELTKAPQSLINKLRKQKVLIDDGNEIKLEVNMKKVFCHRCEYYQNREHFCDNRDLSDKSLFEWEIDKHLRQEHHLGYKYENGTKIDVPIEQKQYDEYIKTVKPKFEIHEHKYKVTKIDNSDFDHVTIELICERCKDDVTIYRHDVSPCMKEIK